MRLGVKWLKIRRLLEAVVTGVLPPSSMRSIPFCRSPRLPYCRKVSHCHSWRRNRRQKSSKLSSLFGWGYRKDIGRISVELCNVRSQLVRTQDSSRSFARFAQRGKHDGCRLCTSCELTANRRSRVRPSSSKRDHRSPSPEPLYYDGEASISSPSMSNVQAHAPLLFRRKRTITETLKVALGVVSGSLHFVDRTSCTHEFTATAGRELLPAVRVF